MKLYLTSESWQKMSYFVDEVKTEISGLGKVEKTEEGEFIVTDVRIFEQVVSGAHSDIEAEALAKFQVELIKGNENPAEWVLWWHSHASMKTFFSQRDTDTIDESTDFRYLISLVTNHAHDFDARVDIFDPCRIWTALDTEVLPTEPDPKLIKSCQKQIKAKIKTPPPRKVGFQEMKGKGKAQPLWNRSHNVNDEEEEEAPRMLPVSEILENEEWEREAEAYYSEKIEARELLDEAIRSKNKADIQVAGFEMNELIQRGKDAGFETKK